MSGAFPSFLNDWKMAMSAVWVMLSPVFVARGETEQQLYPRFWTCTRPRHGTVQRHEVTSMTVTRRVGTDGLEQCLNLHAKSFHNLACTLNLCSWFVRVRTFQSAGACSVYPSTPSRCSDALVSYPSLITTSPPHSRSNATVL